MYIVGHCVVTERSGVFPPGDASTTQVVGLMLPDIVRCHDWGYRACFDPLPESLHGKLIRAHMLGDWYVHYGDRREQKKLGFAYRKMAVFGRRYNSFHSRLHEAGLRDPSLPMDSPRGYSHTMVEYSIDTWLARQGAFDAHFAAAKHCMRHVGSPEADVGSRSWVDGVLCEEALTRANTDLQEDLDSYRTRVSQARKPEDFAVFAAIKKFNVADVPQAIDLVRDEISFGLDTFADQEMEDLVGATSEFIRREFSGTSPSPAGGHAWT